MPRINVARRCIIWWNISYLQLKETCLPLSDAVALLGNFHVLATTRQVGLTVYGTYRIRVNLIRIKFTRYNIDL